MTNGRAAKMRVTFVVAMTLLFAFAASPDSAQGSFPGENGRFVLTWDFDAEGVGTDFLATTDKTGGDFRVLRGCSYECHHRSGDWSPNGRRLVYVNECPDCRNRLVIVRPNGSYPRVVYRAREYPLSSPVWSPDGRRIAFVEYLWSNRVGDWVSDVYIIQRDGTRLTRVTHTPRKDEYDLDWSSRNRLVFVRSCAACLKGELFTMRPNGLALRQLTDNDVADIQPEWSPGGGRLTFVRRWGEIWRMGAWGANASRIASGHSPAWAPDGSLIAFVAAADGAIHTVKPSGEDDILLGTPVQEGSIHELDWQPR